MAEQENKILKLRRFTPVNGRSSDRTLKALAIKETVTTSTAPARPVCRACKKI